MPKSSSQIKTSSQVLLLLILLVIVFIWHLSVGAKTIKFTSVWQALIAFDDRQFDHIVIRELRLMRAIFAMLAGASLSVAGALMQAVTRNSLASPSVLGVLSGSSLAVVITIGFFGVLPPKFMPLVAAIGAILTAILVWGIATKASNISFAKSNHTNNSLSQSTTPLILVLSGSVVAAFFGAIITMINLLSTDSFQNLRVWLSGSLASNPNASINLQVLYWVLPWLLLGLILALAICRQLTVLAMGKETAIGLGVNTARIQTIALIAVISLSAVAIALAGPLGFVGLVIPHTVRLFVGSDYRYIVPFSAIAGALYLLVIDTFARILFAPLDISTGIMTAIVGAPFFVWLVRARL